MDKINFERIKSIITALDFEIPESNAKNQFIAEELFLHLCEVCVRKDFPEEAYRHIEIMIAYKLILDDIEQKKKLETEANLGIPNQAKSISIENTKVEFNTDSKLPGKYDEIQDTIYSKQIRQYDSFVNRYRKLVW